MGIILAGLSHHTASLDLRERVVYERSEAVDALKRLRRESDISQALLVSTCNRTELYALVPEDNALKDYLVESVFLSRAPDANGTMRKSLYRRENASAVEHLFRVVCGLDSMIIGEQQILGQVKTAYEVSQEADTAGTLFHRLAARAFHMGKRVRTETCIGEGAVSVAFAAVELAEKVFGSLENRGVLVVGAGEHGTLCAEHLASRKVSPLLVANRTLEKAQRVALDLGGDAVPFDNMESALERVDIVVGTTGSPDVTVTRDMVERAQKKRSRRDLILIDVAVPRDIDPGVDSLPNVFRFDMDALQDIVEQNKSLRTRELPAVEKMIHEETGRFMQWWESLSSSPVIRDLHAHFEAIREAEVERNAKRFVKEDREQLDVFTRSLVRKLLMDVTKELKGYRSDQPEHAERLAALRHLFRLGKEGKQHDDEV